MGSASTWLFTEASILLHMDLFPWLPEFPKTRLLASSAMSDARDMARQKPWWFSWRSLKVPHMMMSGITSLVPRESVSLVLTQGQKHWAPSLEERSIREVGNIFLNDHTALLNVSEKNQKPACGCSVTSLFLTTSLGFHWRNPRLPQKGVNAENVSVTSK